MVSQMGTDAVVESTASRLCRFDVWDPVDRISWVRWPPDTKVVRDLFPDGSGFYSSEPGVVDHGGTKSRMWTLIVATLKEVSAEEWAGAGSVMGALLDVALNPLTCIRDGVTVRSATVGSEMDTLAEWEMQMNCGHLGTLVDVRGVLKEHGAGLALKLGVKGVQSAFSKISIS
jgi:hypothetical protein